VSCPKKLAFILFALSVGSPCTGYASSGTEGASFLDIPVGAGPAALGSAYGPLATDAYAPIYNPAGLGSVFAPQLAAQHLSYIESVSHEFGSFVYPLSRDGARPTKAVGGIHSIFGGAEALRVGMNLEPLTGISRFITRPTPSPMVNTSVRPCL
jgi:hypothetical protein